MKLALAAFAGFVFSLAIFVSGGLVAIWFLTAEPVDQPGAGRDTASAWTMEPRAVNTAAEALERVPGGTPEAPAPAPEGPAQASAPPVDPMTTGAIAADPTPAPSEETKPADAIVAAHVDWCASRYRSYRPRDNSYTPYSGGRQPCISPYWDALTGQIEPLSPAPTDGDSFAEEAAPAMEYISADAADSIALTPEHVSSCFSRYRSYRPEDNSYQPYGGGPRRQCE